MIHTDRQLVKAREQVQKLLDAARGGQTGTLDIDPTILEASKVAVEAQAQDITQEIHEYEQLKAGNVPVPDLSELAQLHRNLIRARIALGLTQRDLAERLGIAEQQIQRYEANEYAGASLSRLREIATALGEATGEAPAVSRVSELRTKLRASSLPASVIDRLVPARTDVPGAFGDFAARTARALGVALQDLLGPGPLVLAPPASAFKLPGVANSEAVLAYSTYARHVAEAINACANTGVKRLPSDPGVLRQMCIDEEGDFSLRSLLHVAWDCGVVVIPLNDPGQFHGAFWMIDDRPVVVLKQGSRSEERWLFDLAHELCHVSDHVTGRHLQPSGTIDTDTLAGWSDDPIEQRANRFAGRATLGQAADDMASRSVELAGGKVELLKRTVQVVADENGVSAGSLANYIAFRLAGQGINWWGAAANMQSVGSDPWRTVRDAMLGRLDLGKIDSVSMALIIQAVAE